MSERVVVACTGDWHTEAVLNTLDRLGRKTIFVTLQGNPLAFQSWQYVDTIALTVPWFLKLGLHLESRVRGFSEAISNFLRLQWFDKQVADIISRHAPTHCFLWAAMAERSIGSANEIGAKSILFLGSTPFFSRVERQSAGERVREIPRWTKSQRREFETADTVWVESAYLAETVKGLGIPARQIVALTPPIDVDSFRAKDPGSPSRTGPVQVAIVQGSMLKGTRVLFDIWPDLHPTAQLNIYGSLDRNLRPNLPKGAMHHGNLAKSAYRQQLAANDIAVFPTYADGGPRALFEAMATGLCPIATNASAAPEVIEDGVSGFVIPSGDGEALKARLLWCMDHPAETQRMGEKAREAILKAHDKSAFTDAFQKKFLY